ncbi:MAG: hypothetical protein N0C88_21280 [Candidatus Thiodiazotropha lotti]|nr:hypothetical protein [Candidatus Thiodiazotropha lotti]
METRSWQIQQVVLAELLAVLVLVLIVAWAGDLTAAHQRVSAD